MYIAADNSFTDQKKQGVSKSLKSASFHAEILDSIKFGMRPYLNGAKQVERQNLSGVIEVLRMKNMEPVWIEIGKPVPVKELISPVVHLAKEITETADKVVKPKLSKKLRTHLTEMQKTGGEINIDRDQKHYIFVPFIGHTAIQLTRKQTHKIIEYADSTDYHLGTNYIFNKS